jgi:hypothetical protein
MPHGHAGFGDAVLAAVAAVHPGRPVQVDPIKPTFKAPGTKRLKLKYEELLSNFGFKFSLRRYTLAGAPSACTGAR